MAVEHQEKVLQEIPQIVPETGVSGDYNNAYQVFSAGAIDADWWDMDTLEELKKKHAEGKTKIVSRYEERYPESAYDHSKIKDESRKRIDNLNTITDEINSLFASEQYDREKFFWLYVKAYGIIFGRNDKRYLEFLKDLEEEFVKKDKI
ncbi:MAG: hypothetical protein Q8L09_00160 [Candidatus Moranbacteria bacterium]|nr:hypothetical protein [Candidatus Moranbacteria bacterium]